MTNDIFEAMRTRRSVRTFDGTPLTSVERSEIEKIIQMSTLAAPFGKDARYRIGISDVDMDGDFKPGTYGIIKGAKTYLTMTVGPSPVDARTAGFAMEEVVLFAWQHGLGTCWLGGTFKASTFLGSTNVPDGEKLRIVVPIGHPADRRRFMDRVTRMIAGSDRRREFGRLFFIDDWQSPLMRNSAFGYSLEAMRLAPSSTNSQPWRALVDGDTVHFYAVRGRFSDIDMGIGICHFALAEQTDNHLGLLFDAQDHPDAPDAKTDYIRSYRREL